MIFSLDVKTIRNRNNLCYALKWTNPMSITVKLLITSVNGPRRALELLVAYSVKIANGKVVNNSNVVPIRTTD